MLVPAPVFDVDSTAYGLAGEPELGLEQGPEPLPGPVVVRDLKVWIAVHVIDGAVRPAAEAEGDELANLADQIRGAKAPGRDDQDLLILRLE